MNKQDREQQAQHLVALGLFDTPERQRATPLDENEVWKRARQIAAARSRITITTSTPHGRRNVQTFGIADPHAQGAEKWRIDTPRSRRQSAAFDRALRNRPPATPFDAVAAQMANQRTEPLGIGDTATLGAGTIHLAKGLDPSTAVLAFILDALISGNRNTVDLEDLKKVVPQTSPRINQLKQLSGDALRHAQQALYSQILERCTKF